MDTIVRILAGVGAGMLATGCGSSSYEPFHFQEFQSGMPVAQVRSILGQNGFEIDMDQKFPEGEYGILFASKGEDQRSLGMCSAKLATAGAVLSVNQASMNKLIRELTSGYGAPQEVIATKDRKLPASKVDLVMQEIVDRQYDVTLTWRTPFGHALLKFDHGADRVVMYVEKRLDRNEGGDMPYLWHRDYADI